MGGIAQLRFSNRLWLRPIGLEKRTSAAKAVKRQAIYGTAEAVPFVKSFLSIWLKPSPTLKACPSFDSPPQPLLKI
jgi:hypothetical protein